MIINFFLNPMPWWFVVTSTIQKLIYCRICLVVKEQLIAVNLHIPEVVHKCYSNQHPDQNCYTSHLSGYLWLYWMKVLMQLAETWKKLLGMGTSYVLPIAIQRQFILSLFLAFLVLLALSYGCIKPIVFI